jgi:chromosome partitioning protein
MSKQIQILPVLNKKGGVGKTTTAVNVAAGLARRGRDVLLVDLDGQGSASISLGVSNDNLTPSSADVLSDNIPVDEAIRSTERDSLDLLTGSLDLAGTEKALQSQARSQYRLSEILGSLRTTYDTIVIDCEPSASTLTLNAIVAADAFLVPVSPSYLAYEGLLSLFKMIRYVRIELGEAAPILGVVLTMVKPEATSAEVPIRQLRKHLGGKVFDAEIHVDPHLEEAPIEGTDVFQYAPASTGANDYQQLVKEIEERLQRYGAAYQTLENSLSSKGGEVQAEALPSLEAMKSKLSA